MLKTYASTFAIVSVGALCCACQTTPVRYANEGAQVTYHATYEAAATGASAMRATGGELYVGAGSAFRAPLHDLNVMQDQIAPVLLRAEAKPYDLAGLNSCSDVLDRVAELDLALGPDIDSPKQRKRTRVARGADFAAQAALDAAGSAAEHFIPLRSTLKQITGATRYENHVKHAVLAGNTRRSFLKAVGMEHDCSWPAAPLQFTPVHVADLNAPWSVVASPAPAQAPVAAVLLASAGGRPEPLNTLNTASPSTAPLAATRVTVRTVAPPARVILISAAKPSSRPKPVLIAIHERLPIPSPDVSLPDQTWRPPADESSIVAVSTPLAAHAMISDGSPQAPWSASFAGGRSVHP